jgi:hypothetical protein
VALVVISSDAKWRTTWVSKALQLKGFLTQWENWLCLDFASVFCCILEKRAWH